MTCENCKLGKVILANIKRVDLLCGDGNYHNLDKSCPFSVISLDSKKPVVQRMSFETSDIGSHQQFVSMGDTECIHPEKSSRK